MPEDNPLVSLQRDVATLTGRIRRLEDDTSSVVLIQGRVLSALNDLQTSILKVREALLKVKERIG